MAVGAEIAAAVSDGQALDRPAAYRTGFATTVSHTKVKVGSAQLTAGAFIGINTGAFAVNSQLQDIYNNTVKLSDLFR